MRQELQWGAQRSTGLVDVLDRVLDKGLVIAGDIKISLAEVELLTIRIRLIVCSIDKAEQVGLDWWKYDHHLAPGRQPLLAENESLRKQIQILEKKVAQLAEDNVAVRRSTHDAEVSTGVHPKSVDSGRRRRKSVPAGPRRR
ncbi:MAG TPA: gas vesicle protein [Labilithrix sp.]|nr:gas vesicle protein [Labilithrix sp.]